MGGNYPSHDALFFVFVLGNGHLIAAVVLGVIGMAFHPMIVEMVLFAKVQKRFPKIGI